MNNIHIVQPHTDKELRRFAKIANMPIEYVKFIDHMRDRYILWEHDYVKKEDNPLVR